MMKAIFVLTFMVSVLPFKSEAKALELKKNGRSIFIEEKTNWTLGKDLFGMPFIYFSPQINGQRSNISFTDTGADVELDIKALAASQDSYQEGRKEWASKVGANVQGYLPYEVKVNKHGHKIHRIGFTYEHEGKTYLEKSYYTECRSRIIFAKSLRLTINEKHDSDFEDLMSSLDCGGI
jgi:hypothetical protein